MNSVTQHLTAATIAATLLAMRSGRKEIFLIVEGDSDVDLLSQVFCLDHSSFLSCRGKENLDEVYKLSPAKGIDEGAIFIRDRDHDGVVHSDNHGTKLFVTDFYDIEMQLLSSRIFERIYREFHHGQIDKKLVLARFASVVEISAWMGSLRLYNTQSKSGIDFDDVKLSRFINVRTLDIDVSEFIRYMFAKSKTAANDLAKIEADVRALNNSLPDKAMLVCGKDFLEVFHLVLHRHLKLCPSSEAEPIILTRILRAAATLEDLKSMSMYPLLAEHVGKIKFHWPGCAL